jgi:hypothetical protein
MGEAVKRGDVVQVNNPSSRLYLCIGTIEMIPAVPCVAYVQLLGAQAGGEMAFEFEELRPIETKTGGLMR